MINSIKKVKRKHFINILNLYQLVSKGNNGIARKKNEITIEYIKNIINHSLKSGLGLIVENENKEIIAEIHCFKLEPIVFDHVLSNLTIVVHPKYQNKGIGKSLFTALLNKIEKTRDDILRVELITRESNKKAIKMYESLGFVVEGKFNYRIKNYNEQFEADIPVLAP